MDETERRRRRKWLILGAGGGLSGLVALLVFRSIPIASGTAAVIVVAIIVVKHLALAIAVGSPTVAILRSVRKHLQDVCPFRPA